MSSTSIVFGDLVLPLSDVGTVASSSEQCHDPSGPRLRTAGETRWVAWDGVKGSLDFGNSEALFAVVLGNFERVEQIRITLCTAGKRTHQHKNQDEFWL